MQIPAMTVSENGQTQPPFSPYNHIINEPEERRQQFNQELRAHWSSDAGTAATVV